MRFEDLEFKPHRVSEFGGDQAIVFFSNGYGASVIRGSRLVYGGSDGLSELAVLAGNAAGWEITYKTPITDDDVTILLGEIEALPKRDA